MTKPTDAERNRLKQQRSRARRKEYLTELEDRLRTYERNGVQATVEVQNAARHVVHENQLLRELLCQHDVSPAQVDAFLKSKTHAQNAGPSDQTSSVKTESVKRLRPAQSSSPLPQANQEAVAQDSKGPQISTQHANDFGHQDFAERSAETKHLDLPHQDAPHEDLAESQGGESAGGATPTHSAAFHAMRQAVYSDHISCEEAAHVIASMRGASDAQDILPELGCSGSSKCMVKSSVVFDLS
ncbi:hypothetical protein C1H76_8473 [Elsinoe australis]|uniref:BZIP domain-containing protein n=1 Tax=Elsinoe australis TaxID=40998 RepID=A0A4U7AMI7_9PEZI|nr:hypothetical protein C1H76_8473 [Elsinoe australis]